MICGVCVCVLPWRASRRNLESVKAFGFFFVSTTDAFVRPAFNA